MSHAIQVLRVIASNLQRPGQLGIVTAEFIREQTHLSKTATQTAIDQLLAYGWITLRKDETEPGGGIAYDRQYKRPTYLLNPQYGPAPMGRPVETITTAGWAELQRRGYAAD